MSDEQARTGCGVQCPVCRNGAIVVLLILLGSTTTGWIVTVTRDRPVTFPALPTVAPVVTPPVLPPIDRPSAPGAPELVEVLVAAKDLPVGTVLTREDLARDTVVKSKKVPKDALPPTYVIFREDLVDKRLSRPVHAEEPLNPQDLLTSGTITLPPGMNMVSLQLSVAQAAAGFVGPGSRVNVLATIRHGHRLHAFPLLVNMLVVAVDAHTTLGKDGPFPTLNTVSFAVTEKQALLLALAKKQGCSLELMLRNPSETPEADKDYDIDRVIKLISNERDQTGPPPSPAPPEPMPEPIETAPAPRPVVDPIPPAGE
jgi:Flp pilus assembly protein CpaB